MARRRTDRWHHLPPEGESYRMLAARLRPWLAGIGARERLVVVAHGAVGRVLRGLCEGLPGHRVPELEEPQDACFRLRAGRTTRVDAVD